jgi:LAO/AO transport system kinase
MTDKRSPRKKKKSALSVVDGVTGGHEGLPGNRPPAGGSTVRRPEYTPAELAEGVRAGDRGLLARAITLVESNAPEHFRQSQQMLKQLLPHAGGSIRVGVTGIPGAGKSTLIESLGQLLTGRGHQVAVTAVDPSSSRSGGSILGDKTRMEQLSVNPHAFIRPSPSGGALGGVARKTRETILLFEAAGYDVVLVETIGVGQSEVAVRSMVDFFLLVLVAGAGDELQGLKRGVMELADAVLVNKADGDNRERAELARATHQQAMTYLRPATDGWESRAFTASALHGTGIETLWSVVDTFARTTAASGVFHRRRQSQERDWMHAMLDGQLRRRFLGHPDVGERLPGLEQAVMDGEVTAAAAAQELLDLFSS